MLLSGNEAYVYPANEIIINISELIAIEASENAAYTQHGFQLEIINDFGN